MSWEIVTIIDLDGQEIGHAIYDSKKETVIRPFKGDPRSVMTENALRKIIRVMKKKNPDLGKLEGSITEDDLNETLPS